MKKLIENILNVFYPRCCPVCQKVLKDQNRMICPECEENLHPVGHPRCFLCGKPVNAGEYCRDCEKHHHLFDQGIGIFVYDERMRSLLHDINTTAAESMEIFMQLPCTDSAERKSSDGTHS